MDMQTRNADGSSWAFRLSATGVGIQIAAIGIVFGLIAWGLRELEGDHAFDAALWRPYIGWIAVTWLALGALDIGLGVWGLLRMRSAEPRVARRGSKLVLASALLAVPTGGGLLFGSLLMVVGSLLELRTKPSSRQTGEAPPQFAGDGR